MILYSVTFIPFTEFVVVAVVAVVVVVITSRKSHVYTVSKKKSAKMFGHIFYKIRPILIQVGT